MKHLATLYFLFLSIVTYSQDFTTVRSGRSSDPATWGGELPPASASITVQPKHTLTFSGDMSVCDLTVLKGGTITFDQNKKPSTVTVYGNIEVHGRLIRKASSIHDSIVLVGIKEAASTGGGMNIIPTDRGIWVRGDGIIEIEGSEKTPWAHLAKPVYAEDKIILLNTAPKGWRIGDEIVVVPSGYSYKDFETRKVVSVKGATVVVDSAFSFDHPSITNQFNGAVYTAEVMNLTRTFYIGGTGDGSANPENNGRAHLNIMNNAPSIIRYVELRNMGPRRQLEQFTEGQIGRYMLHFHHCGNGSRGSLVEGVVARDGGNHAFVPHASHGITFRKNIAYRTFEDQYWWDLPLSERDTSNNSHDIVYDSCIAAAAFADPPFRGYRLAGFMLGSGKGNKVINCISVGNQGSGSAPGFVWLEHSNYTPNNWVFTNNLTHNNRSNGIFTWQNDTSDHHINGFIAYRNGNHGVEHGAYVNGYKYRDMYLLENKGMGFFLHANPIKRGPKDEDGYIMSVRNIYSTEPLYIAPHTLLGEGPVLFKNCFFPKVIVSELPRRMHIPPFGLIDLVNCHLTPEQFEIRSMEDDSRIRVQDKKVFQLTIKGLEAIPAFFK